MPVTIVRRPSTPSTYPQTFASSGSKLEPMASGSGVAVVLFALGPLRRLMPTASAQHSGAMPGLVPVGAKTPPTAWQLGSPLTATKPWKSFAAFWSWGRVGELSGRSCLIRLRTSGVYGAARSTGGEVAVSGSRTGSWYGGASARAGATARTTLATASATIRPMLIFPSHRTTRGRMPRTGAICQLHAELALVLVVRCQVLGRPRDAAQLLHVAVGGRRRLLRRASVLARAEVGRVPLRPLVRRGRLLEGVVVLGR